jgi:peptidoglycan/LPS O-acetylase OafA/YrhL
LLIFGRVLYCERNSKMKEIVSLTSLRGVAASIVVIYHLSPGICESIGCQTGLPFFSNGQLMVDFFFILSGFILTYAYSSGHWTKGNWLEIRTFLLRRFARIYPAHFFMLIVFIAYELVDLVVHSMVLDSNDGVWFTGSTSITSIFTNLLLIQSWGIHDTLTWNQPSWSISAEFVAYILFPILAWHSPILRMPGIAAAVTAVLFLILIGIEWNTGHLTGGHSTGVLVCVAEFVYGMVLYMWVSPFRSLENRELSFLQIAIELLSNLVFGHFHQAAT